MKGFIENTEETHTEREGDRQTGRQADGERERGPFASSVGDSFNMDPFVFD